MSVMIEREVKLRFESAEQARAAVLDAGATPVRERRLQEDCLLDTRDLALQRAGTALRVRNESGASLITFKGPVQASAMKVREEIETAVGDGALMLTLLGQLGFVPCFRAQKYREEFASDGCIVAVDETPAGTFVEIEGSEGGIAAMAAALGRSPADYLVASYRSLYSDYCRQRGLIVTDMVFTEDD